MKSYNVAHRELIPDTIRDTSQYANNRAELSHQPTRVRERWGYTDKQNPCLGIRGYKETGRKDIYIEDEIFEAVYEAASTPLKEAMAFSLSNRSKAVRCP